MSSTNYRTGILITGASGGLGKQLTLLARNLPGIDVVVATDIRQPGSGQTDENTKVLSMTMDVGSETSIRQVKKELAEQRIRIRYIINNAGTHAFFPVTESTEKLLDRILRVNVIGPVLTVSVFLEDLIEMQGRVIQVSSDSVRLPIPFYTYPASKVAQEAFSVSMRRELQLHGVKLVIVRPGAMQTPFLEAMKSIKNEVEDSRYRQWFETFATLSRESVGRRLDPAVVAKLIMHMITVKNPRLVYAINKNRKISFFRVFPEKLKDRLIRRTVS